MNFCSFNGHPRAWWRRPRWRGAAKHDRVQAASALGQRQCGDHDKSGHTPHRRWLRAASSPSCSWPRSCSRECWQANGHGDDEWNEPPFRLLFLVLFFGPACFAPFPAVWASMVGCDRTNESHQRPSTVFGSTSEDLHPVASDIKSLALCRIFANIWPRIIRHRASFLLPLSCFSTWIRSRISTAPFQRTSVYHTCCHQTHKTIKLERCSFTHDLASPVKNLRSHSPYHPKFLSDHYRSTIHAGRERGGERRPELWRHDRIYGGKCVWFKDITRPSLQLCQRPTFSLDHVRSMYIQRPKHNTSPLMQLMSVVDE
jgi:hypothetical protein